jgi:two-component system, response regulator RegA
MMETFLVVDDDDRFRVRIVRALVERGYSAEGVGSRDECINLSMTRVFENAIVDLRMPGGSGIEVVSHLKGTYPPIKIVVVTGYGSIATAVEAIRRGALDYISKPCDLDSILDRLKINNWSSELASSIPSTPSLSDVEWEHLQRVLADCHGNVTQAAKRLGLHRRSLQRKLSKGA